MGGIMWAQIDTCLVWPTNGKAYLLSGDEYVRYDIASDRVDPGYPAPIAGNWPGLWSPVGAGVIWPNGKVYFLRGNQYVRYDIASDRVDPGYPAPIAGNWPGLSLQRVDAALVWPGDKKAYLFGHYGGVPGQLVSGRLGYVRYDIDNDRQDDGYPASIEQNWPGLPPDINSCVLWPNGKVYFFRANYYFRYDIPSDRVDPGYPAPIAGNWPGVPIVPPGPVTGPD
jgi:hypothetical protein